jgi:hypothetical protein
MTGFQTLEASMARPVDVLILSHRDDPSFDVATSTIKLLFTYWREMGLTVAVERGASYFARPHAALAVNHVTHTVTPPAYRRYLSRFPAVINGRLTDISKTKYSRDLLTQTDGYAGPVIIKTDLNSGGYSEHYLPSRNRLAGYLRPVLNRLGVREYPDPDAPLGGTVYLSPHAYPVYEHASLVPAGAWSNPNLVVQKFQPEMEGPGLYRLRCWYVLGDRGFHVVTVARNPVVRGTDIVKRWVTLEATPPELEAVRRAMHVDYGRIDYVMAEGKPVVYDINRTPTSSPAAAGEYASEWRDLAQGILDFLT